MDHTTIEWYFNNNNQWVDNNYRQWFPQDGGIDIYMELIESKLKILNEKKVYAHGELVRSKLKILEENIIQ